MVKKKDIQSAESALFNEISTLIEQSQAQVVSHVNSALTMLFWKVGRRINEFVLWNTKEPNRMLKSVKTQFPPLMAGDKSIMMFSTHCSSLVKHQRLTIFTC